MRTMNTIALILVVIGALNWLLVGLFSYDLVAAIFGTMSTVSRIIYTLVGLSGLWALFVVLPRLASRHEYGYGQVQAT